jgi:glycine cleavage system H protein
VLERNEDAISAPEVVNQSPYGDAWLVKVKIADPDQVESLMNPDEYETFAEAAAH